MFFELTERYVELFGACLLFCFLFSKAICPKSQTFRADCLVHSRMLTLFIVVVFNHAF